MAGSPNATRPTPPAGEPRPRRREPAAVQPEAGRGGQGQGRGLMVGQGWGGLGRAARAARQGGGGRVVQWLLRVGYRCQVSKLWARNAPNTRGVHAASGERPARSSGKNKRKKQKTISIRTRDQIPPERRISESGRVGENQTLQSTKGRCRTVASFNNPRNAHQAVLSTVRDPLGTAGVHYHSQYCFVNCKHKFSQYRRDAGSGSAAKVNRSGCHSGAGPGSHGTFTTPVACSLNSLRRGRGWIGRDPRVQKAASRCWAASGQGQGSPSAETRPHNTKQGLST